MITAIKPTSLTTIKVTATCDLDGSETNMVFTLTPEDFDSFLPNLCKWQERKLLIQEAFPRLNKDEREFMVTGITPDKWNDMFREVI